MAQQPWQKCFWSIRNEVRLEIGGITREVGVGGEVGVGPVLGAALSVAVLEAVPEWKGVGVCTYLSGRVCVCVCART